MTEKKIDLGVVAIFVLLFIILFFAIWVNVQRQKIDNLNSEKQILQNQIDNFPNISWTQFTITGKDVALYVNGEKFISLNGTNFTSFGFMMNCEKSSSQSLASYPSQEVLQRIYNSSIHKYNLTEWYTSI
jgi:hypothetical protein